MNKKCQGGCCEHRGSCRPFDKGCKRVVRRRQDCKQFLHDSWSRLANDMEPYLQKVSEMREHGDHRGYWFISREIFPVIESVGTALYGKDGQIRVLEDLKHPYPVLTWEMYRHSLIHSDRPRGAKLGKTYAGWSISLGEFDYELMTSNILAPDILYDRLLQYLKDTSETTKRKTVLVEESVVFCRHVSKDSRLRSEFAALRKRRAERRSAASAHSAE